MTVETNGAMPRKFVTAILPWIVGAVGLLVYLVTLNRWISLFNLATVTQVSGWSWWPMLGQPLTWILLYPFRWLPEPMIPLALNVFTAVCAAMVLVLLARSVALLPRDPAPHRPRRPAHPIPSLPARAAWMPPVLATILCGLQLSFWEHATSASGEMINLLVLAYVIRCLLEFGSDRNPSWFSRGALACGAGMANSGAMVILLPVFAAAILRTHGLVASLNRRFLLRLTLWGLAGLSLYLLLPAVQSFSSDSGMNFWTALKAHLKLQMGAGAAMQAPSFRLLALATLLPVLILFIRWSPLTVQLGDDTPLGILLTRTTGHLMHGGFLVVCLWVALDPEFSPRHLGMGVPLLGCYYVSALAFGYCVGYFLRFGSGVTEKRPASAPVTAAWILTGVLPLALLARNLDQILTTNGPWVREFARQLYTDLPAGKCMVLSEDAKQLSLLQAELVTHGGEKDPILLGTAALPSVQYHVFMARQFGSRWPFVPPTNEAQVVGPLKVQEIISKFAAREQVVYLHPSSGLLCEPFVVQPQGSIHSLVPCPTGRIVAQTLDERIVAANEQIWQQRWTNSLKRLAEHTRERTGYAPPWANVMLILLQLRPERNVTASILGAAYSKMLNYWGVEMQRLDRWAQAAVWYRRAIELNPDSVSARINLRFNEQWQGGDTRRLDDVLLEQQSGRLFAKYDNWPEVLSANGPVDEPTFLSKSARVWLQSGNFRQAIRAFARCVDLAPEWPAPKLWLADGYLRFGDFAGVLEATDSLQACGQALEGKASADLLYCRATALRRLGRAGEAAACVESFVSRYREQDEVLSMAAEVYAEAQQLGASLALLDQLLKRNPNDPRLLGRKGLVQLKLSRYDAAISTLSRALSLVPSDQEARLYRAAAYFAAGRLEEAGGDYEELLKTAHNPHNALFGLGAIAWRQRDTNAAIGFYQQYLSNAVPDSPQFAVVAQRLQQLKDNKAP